jgi:hypothetical protein
MTLNRSLPKLTKEDKIPEPDRNVRLAGDFSVNPAAPQDLIYEELESAFFSMEYQNQYREMMLANGFKEEEFIPAPDVDLHALFDLPKKNLPVMKSKGLPQGSPTSPFLSNLVLKESLFKV